MIVRLGSRWFSRRWVIQELALAKDTEVRCGEKSVHWRDFGDAISLFVMHFKQIRKLLSEHHQTYLGWQMMASLPQIEARPKSWSHQCVAKPGVAGAHTGNAGAKIR